MSSREKILSAIKKNQPETAGLPDITIPSSEANDAAERFSTILTSIGGAVIRVNNPEEVLEYISKNFARKKIVSTIPELAHKTDVTDFLNEPHQLKDVNLAVLRGHFAVAENGAVWITDDQTGDRALPFISEHLALVVREKDIVATMHDAYEKIGSSYYNFGTFIAGPSKTADIEQSLVLGAHGAKSLIVFFVRD